MSAKTKQRQSHDSVLRARLYRKLPEEVHPLLTKAEVRLNLKHLRGKPGTYVRLRLTFQGRTLKFPFELAPTFPSPRLVAQLMLTAL